ncbi:MAG: zinc metalloprotease HtpX [Candidatus Methanomethylicia archaeon]|nr:zinc metalloprotease HtpX [Candidatus Methanomethylicia archaeon]MCX8168922.1 zinc metalloprotease HtpX [Candidatus Methanomethylicia archaeon]MDW7988654.1 zinc metalloprotease HtpX [Nitrososphaerota archaeon]
MFGRVVLLFGIMTGLLMFVGFAIGSLFGSPLTAIQISLLMALLMNLFTYLFSDKIVLSMTRARIVSESEYPRLHRMVERVANSANIPKPKVAIVESSAPNAFATGRGPKNGVVAVTKGLLSILNEDEIEAVIGHEIAHIKNRDILISTIAATIAGAISYLAYLGRWGVLWSAGDRRRNEGSIITAMLAAILAPIAAMLVQLAISREREYGSDEDGVKITRKPMSLANALIKISGAKNLGLTLNVNPSTSHLWIVNPLRGGTLEELFSTHPPVEKRVERLKKIAREMGIYYM